MAIFYTLDDLSARRQALALYLTSSITTIGNHYFYNTELTGCTKSNLQYLTAMLEVIECYTPITDEDDDGEINCLTESDLDSAFENISKISGLCFQPKGNTYSPNTNVEETTTTLGTNTENIITLNIGSNINLNTKI